MIGYTKTNNMSPDVSGNAPAGGLPVSSIHTSTNYFSQRIQSLDVLRGIAVLGALFISIWIFGGFTSNHQNGLLLQSKGGNYRLLGTVDLLLNGKMRALIAVIFGAGMVVFISRKNLINKVSTDDLFIRRQIWLIGFGLINGMLFLWSGDLLFHLGIMGILLFPLIRLSSKTLLIVSVITMLIFSGKIYWNYSEDQTAHTKYTAVLSVEKKLSKDSLARAQKKLATKVTSKDSLSKEQIEDKSAWEGIAASKKYDVKKNEAGLKEMRSGSYGTIWDYVIPRTQSREAPWTYETGIWDLSSMILLGMALFKFGFFGTDFPRKKYILLLVLGLGGGLLLGWFRLQYKQYGLQDYSKYVFNHWAPYDLFFPFERALLVLGYSSLVLMLLRAGTLKSLWAAFAAAGQMALTNYLLQSIICTLFFAGFGFGYFGRLEQWQLYLVAFEICIVEIALSIFWLKYYTYGPAEWLLRCLIYRKWLPNKIASINDTPPAYLPLADQIKLN